jgi:anthranilate/para-aminobenzoate synthase component I
LYFKLADASTIYLLESVQGGEKWGRYSIIVSPCRNVLRAYEHQVTVSVDDAGRIARVRRPAGLSKFPSKNAIRWWSGVMACRVSMVA